MASIQRENDAIMKRLEQSDAILCNHLEFLHFSSKRKDDNFLMSTINRALPLNVRDVSEEYKMWTQTFTTRTASCPNGIASRFGNSKKEPTSTWNIEPSPVLCGGYECLAPVFNTTSVPEQTKKLFDNMTKRV